MDIEKIKNHLSEQGFRPSIDDDGDIVFKYEGRSYFIGLEKDDEQYIRIAFPNFWAIENEDERSRAIEAAHDSTKMIKVAKIFVVNDNVWGSVELFVMDEESFATIFTRCMLVLQGAVHHFVDSMKSVAPAPSPLSLN